MGPPFLRAAQVLAARRPVVLADCRLYLDGRDARAEYDRAHLPGAVFVDVGRVLAGPPSRAGGRHPLPPAEVFAAGLGTAGIGPDDLVVGYDDAGGSAAARLVWLLRAVGHDAALLDGGPGSWPEPPGAEPVHRGARSLPVRTWPPGLLAGTADAVAPGTVLLDARPGPRYRGEDDPVDVRAGHVPGARSLPARESVGPDGLLLPDDVLRARLAAVGVVAGTDVVSSCGSGVTACHTLLVLERLGLGPGRLWPGSWSQWAATDRPLATGPDPG